MVVVTLNNRGQFALFGGVLTILFILFYMFISASKDHLAANSNINNSVTTISAMAPIVHIVLIKFKPEIPSEALKPVCDAFIKLKETCIHPDNNKPYILSIKGGIDNSTEGQQHGHTHGFVLEFDSLWDRDYYVEKDPAHQVFKGLLGKTIGFDGVTVIDFQDGVY